MVADTERTLTVDANVVKYCFQHRNGDPLSPGLVITGLSTFDGSVLEANPIAINEFIQMEYENVVGVQPVQYWLKKRLQKSLVRMVPYTDLPVPVARTLRDDYGFSSSQADAKYLRTCLNTAAKCLITENTHDFDRPHKKSGKIGMRRYLQKEVSLCLSRVDECCAVYGSSACNLP